VIAVPHNIYGPRQKYDDPFRNVVSIFINTMLRGKQPYVYGDGTQKRCFSYIKDDVPILYRLAVEDKQKVAGQVINVGPDREFVTINQLVATVASVVGVDAAPIHVKDRPLEVRNANCSADKARRVLQYNPVWSLHDGVKELAEWIRLSGVREFNYHIEPEIWNDNMPVTWRDRLF